MQSEKRGTIFPQQKNHVIMNKKQDRTLLFHHLYQHLKFKIFLFLPRYPAIRLQLIPSFIIQNHFILPSCLNENSHREYIQWVEK